MDGDQAGDGSATEPGSAGYPRDTERYRAAGDDGDATAGDDNHAAGGVALWRRQGFDSHEAWLRDLIAEQDRLSRSYGLGGKSDALWFLGDAAAEEVPEITPPPGDEIGDVHRPEPPEHRTKQIGVRLKRRDFELLRAAARAYGVAPSTMARMFVVRGARAVDERPRSGPDRDDASG